MRKRRGRWVTGKSGGLLQTYLRIQILGLNTKEREICVSPVPVYPMPMRLVFRRPVFIL